MVNSGNPIFPVFSYSAITGYQPTCEGTLSHSTEFLNAFCFVMMQWHSETEPVSVPNSMHSCVLEQLTVMTVCGGSWL
jgi:hypothetical protein